MEGEWSFTEVVTNGRRMVMLQKWSLMEGEWSCYRGGHYWRENSHVTEVTNGGRMVMLQRWSLMEGEWSCNGGGQFNGGRKVMLGGQFNGGRMVMLQRWSL